jgi:hypothetical protein
MVNMKQWYLDDLVRELDGDVQSLNMSKNLHHESDNGTVGGLQRIL